MRRLHQPMSFDEFERLPRQPGWKYEYFDGAAHVTPWPAYVTLVLELHPRGGTERPGVGPVAGENDVAALAAAFVAAFEATPDYAHVPAADVPAEASEYLERFFSDRGGRPSPRSRIARVQGLVIGAALVKAGASQPAWFDCVFVRPEHARRGWATAMLRAVERGLADDGETRLVSSAHLANEPSLRWHLRFGFREVPDHLVAAHRARVFAAEASRGRRYGLLGAQEVERCERLASFWHAEAERLREGGQDPWQPGGPG